MLGGKTLPRRDFLRHAVMLAGAGVTAPLWAAMKYNRDAATRYFREQASETDARVNAAPSLNYWCTWSMQGMTRRLPEWRRKVAAIVGETGIAGAGYAGNYIFDELVYGPKGWSKTMFPNSRQRLYMMLDSGWDVPYGSNPRVHGRRYSSLVPDPVRFPNLGGSDVERLRNLDARVAADGWQGIALWVACQCFGEGNGVWFDDKRSFDDWRRRMEMSRKTGIRYWKIDFGPREREGLKYREIVRKAQLDVYPDLVVENKPPHNRAPLNGVGFPKFPKGRACTGSGRIFGQVDFERKDWRGTDIGRICGWSEVVRIYDMLQPFDIPTTFERVAFYSTAIDNVGAKTVLNLEDSVTTAAVLGHTFGIMRAPGIPGGFCDFDEVSHLCDRIAEVDRAVAWQQTAPAFGGRADCPSRFSMNTLTDEWHYQKGDGWVSAAWGRDVRQVAPAVLSRGVALPKVKPLEAEPPFAAAMLHPNGALAVGVFPRVKDGRWWTPRAEVSVDAAPRSGSPIGVFGEMSVLKVKGDLRADGARVFARDIHSAPGTLVSTRLQS